MICLILQLLCIFVGIAFFTLLERKMLGYLQQRKGPNKPGLVGILTPFGDALKLLKESNLPYISNNLMFYLSPLLSLLVAISLWAAYPSFTFKFSILWFLCVSAVGVYAILGAGWRRNRKYTSMGAIRSVAQSISYEVVIAFLILHIGLFISYELFRKKYTMFFLYPVIIILFVTLLAETNRSPFDFSEGESELVRGFNTEYRGVPFIIIFLSEYICIMFISILIASFFSEIFLFTISWAIAFIWTRGTLPRIRYDQLMGVAWKSFLPMTLMSLSQLFVI